MDMMIESMERTLKVELRTMQQAIKQVIGRDRRTLEDIVRKVQVEKKKQQPRKTARGFRRDNHEQTHHEQTHHEQPGHDYSQDDLFGSRDKLSGYGNNHVKKEVTIERDSIEVQKHTCSSTTDDASPWFQPVEETEINMSESNACRRESRGGTGPVIQSGDGNSDGGDGDGGGETIWKAGGAGSHQISMAAARQERMNKEVAVPGMEEKGMEKETPPIFELYKHDNNGSMMWSSPNSRAASTTGRITPDVEHIPHYMLPSPRDEVQERDEERERRDEKRVKDLCDEKLNAHMEWCTKHFDGMSKRIGAHLHQVVLKSLLSKMYKSAVTSEERLMACVHREVQQCHATWEQNHSLQLRDKNFENHSLQLEIHRRSVKSRARKIVQPDPKSWQLKAMPNHQSSMTEKGMVESQSAPLFFPSSKVQKSGDEHVDAWGGSASNSRAQTPVV